MLHVVTYHLLLWKVVRQIVSDGEQIASLLPACSGGGKEGKKLINCCCRSGVQKISLLVELTTLSTSKP